MRMKIGGLRWKHPSAASEEVKRGSLGRKKQVALRDEWVDVLPRETATMVRRKP